MADTSARMLSLLALLQTRRDWSGPELAGRLEVSTRTIRNDVERLRSLDYPVRATRGRAGSYRPANRPAPTPGRTRSAWPTRATRITWPSANSWTKSPAWAAVGA